jgi:mRNA interferase MazF
MGAFTAGQVVLVHFPFSDLTTSNLRPAVVIADAGRGDSILCQITSNAYGGARAISLEAADFVSGALRRSSVVRPGKLFTAHTSLVAGNVGVLRTDKLSAIRDAIVDLVRSG